MIYEPDAELLLIVWAACVKNESIRSATGRIKHTDSASTSSPSLWRDSWKRSSRRNVVWTFSGSDDNKNK